MHTSCINIHEPRKYIVTFYGAWMGEMFNSPGNFENVGVTLNFEVLRKKS